MKDLELILESLEALLTVADLPLKGKIVHRVRAARKALLKIRQEEKEKGEGRERERGIRKERVAIPSKKKR